MSDSRALFITGTGTDVGKTYVSRLLANGFSRLVTVTYQKPVQTGCVRGENGRLRAPDFDSIKEDCPIALGDEEDHVPYLFEPACSPHLAARIAGVRIDIGRISRSHGALGGIAELVLVEGAGGIYVPINEDQTMLDVMKALDFSVILVAAAGLGTLNHTFLSLDVLHSRGIPVAGIVINVRDGVSPSFVIDDNVSHIQSHSASPVLVVGHGDRPGPNIEDFCNGLWKRLSR